SVILGRNREVPRQLFGQLPGRPTLIGLDLADRHRGAANQLAKLCLCQVEGVPPQLEPAAERRGVMHPALLGPVHPHECRNREATRPSVGWSVTCSADCSADCSTSATRWMTRYGVLALCPDLKGNPSVSMATHSGPANQEVMMPQVSDCKWRTAASTQRASR